MAKKYLMDAPVGDLVNAAIQSAFTDAFAEAGNAFRATAMAHERVTALLDAEYTKMMKAFAGQ